MLCAVITGPTLDLIQKQIEAAKAADMLELRWDLFDSLDYQISSSLPVIYTLRPKSQGGHFLGSEEERLNSLETLLQAQPAFVDVEYFVPQQRIASWKVKVIRSFHDFEKTPDNLEPILQAMPHADFYKIAVMANTTNDSLRLLQFLQKHPKNVIGISMGEKGQLTRVARQCWTYCSLGQATAPGQFSLHDFPKQVSEFYGLIGDPVDGSISHMTHNALLAHFESPSFYQKMAVKPEELGEFLNRMKQLPFQGLSVTMPLKEAVMPYLDAIDTEAKSIGAVNTLVISNGKIHGYNTDGIGALKAIQSKMSVKGKRVVVLGAGGAAKAIVYTLQQHGARVTVLNRNPERAKTFCEHYGTLEQITQQQYDILINCTPVMPIPAEHILEGCIFMETKTLPKVTPFLEAAHQRNCTCIYGYEMFVYQAAQQFALWKNWPVTEIEAVLMQAAESERPLHTH